MLQLSKATHDQLAILMCVNQSSDLCVPVQAIASRLRISGPTALKNVNRLVHAKLLRAKRGPGGGVMMARPANSIILGESIKLLEEINTSEDRKPERTRADQRSFDFLAAALAHFIEFLNNFTLADLAAGEAPQAGLPLYRTVGEIPSDNVSFST